VLMAAVLSGAGTFLAIGADAVTPEEAAKIAGDNCEWKTDKGAVVQQLQQQGSDLTQLKEDMGKTREAVGAINGKLDVLVDKLVK